MADLDTGDSLDGFDWRRVFGSADADFVAAVERANVCGLQGVQNAQDPQDTTGRTKIPRRMLLSLALAAVLLAGSVTAVAALSDQFKYVTGDFSPITIEIKLSDGTTPSAWSIRNTLRPDPSLLVDGVVLANAQSIPLEEYGLQIDRLKLQWTESVTYVEIECSVTDEELFAARRSSGPLFRFLDPDGKRLRDTDGYGFYYQDAENPSGPYRAFLHLDDFDPHCDSITLEVYPLQNEKDATRYTVPLIDH
jgi:hypothetical protein